MGAVLLGLSVVALLEWMGILAVSLVESVRFRRWPSEALPLWLHLGLPVLALATWRLGRWVRTSAETSLAADPSSPKVLAILPTEAEATLMVDLLADQGIKALISGTGSSTGWPETPGDVQVVVRQSDFARARQLLERFRRLIKKRSGGA